MRGEARFLARARRAAFDELVGVGFFLACGGVGGFRFGEGVSKAGDADDAADDLTPGLIPLTDVLFGAGVAGAVPHLQHGPEGAEEVLPKLGGGADVVVQVGFGGDGAVLDVAFIDEEEALQEAA